MSIHQVFLVVIFSSSHCAFVYFIHLDLTHAPFIYTERRTTLSLYWSKVSTLLKLNAYVFLSSYRNQRLKQPLATMHNPSFSTANSVLILMITSRTKSQRRLNKCRCSYVHEFVLHLPIAISKQLMPTGCVASKF